MASFDGHIGSGADGDPDIRRRERGRIVHAITYHRDFAPFFLELADLGRFGEAGGESDRRA